MNAPIIDINADQVEQLREERSIYIVKSGRINVAGMTEDTIGRICSAISKVIGQS